MSTSQVTVRCSCGSDKFEMPSSPKANDIVKCAKCGAVGKYGGVMGQARKQAASALEKKVRDALRKAGFK